MNFYLHLLEKARTGPGAIIFIDEIDAIGSRFDRDASGKAGKMTLNQLLVEMDGYVMPISLKLTN